MNLALNKVDNPFTAIVLTATHALGVNVGTTAAHLTQMQSLENIHLRAPATYEGDFIEQGSLDDLSQGLHHVLHINVADEQTQPEAALQLLDAVMHIIRLQQVKSAAHMHKQLLLDYTRLSCSWDQVLARCIHMCIHMQNCIRLVCMREHMHTCTCMHIHMHIHIGAL